MRAGLHPWWSHHISFASTPNSPSSDPLEKQKHYSSLFPGYFDNLESDSAERDLFESFPPPTSFSAFLRSSLHPHLLSHPNAILGEVGLDRSFRIPKPRVDIKSDRGEQAYGRVNKSLTKLQTPLEHQVLLLRRQLEVAFELDRNVSMHSVQAQGVTVDLISNLSKTSVNWNKSKSKICMHSYGGSTDTIFRILRSQPHRIYFSFSTTINSRLDRLEDLIRAVPDERLLLESDYNDIRKSEIRLWEILGIVCDAKAWDREEAVQKLKENWRVFVGETT